MAVIFVASSMPSPPGAGRFNDKIGHAALYGGLAVITLRALAGGARLQATWRTALIAVALAGAYGVTDEIHQSLVPSRQADVYDLVADVVGAAVAVGAVQVLKRYTSASSHGL